MGEGSWLVDTPEASVAAVLAHRPDLAERYQALTGGLWRAGVDAGLLELCRIHLARTLGDVQGAAHRSPEAEGALDEALVARLDRWWSDPAVDDLTRAALGLTEQFAVDVHGVTDERFAELRDRLGPAGSVAFCFALALFDGQSRLRLAFAAHPPTEVTP